MKRLTISVPDEVADRAAATGNASKWFATAGLRMMGAEQYLAAGRQHNTASGITAGDEGVAAAAAALTAARARMTPADWAALRQGPAAARARRQADTDTCETGAA